MKVKTHNYSFRIIIIFIMALLLLFIFACENSNDMPPKMEGPEPEPHKGVFVSDNAIFTFDGSNKTVFVEFDGEYMEELTFSSNPGVFIQYSTICSAVGFAFERIQLQPDDACIAEYP